MCFATQWRAGVKLSRSIATHAQHFSIWAETSAFTCALVSGAALAIAVVTALARTAELTTAFTDIGLLQKIGLRSCRDLAQRQYGLGRMVVAPLRSAAELAGHHARHLSRQPRMARKIRLLFYNRCSRVSGDWRAEAGAFRIDRDRLGDRNKSESRVVIGGT
jgi:hypothetical protein